MTKLELLRETILGFKFENTEDCIFDKYMEQYINVPGKIVEVTENECLVKFEDGESWYYPTDLVIEQIEINAQSIDLNNLFKQIKES